ncbi:MAG: hypothetical protein QOF76_4690 [Solirubrobacteraceae bacterium]|jgi:hypothetical protein|nr:hypothetical protein [Solirubrobacteraceae bacterium]
MARETDIGGAVATYWSMLPVAVTGAQVVAAWSAAAGQVWKDELYVVDEDAAVWADFLFNSGQVRMTVCECALLVPRGDGPATHALTVVADAQADLNLGWALHTRMLEAVCGADWANPTSGARAVESWTSFGATR